MPTLLQIVIGLATVVLAYFQIQKIRMDNRKSAVETRKLELDLRKAEAAESAERALTSQSDADARALRSMFDGLALATRSGISDTVQALVIVVYLWVIAFMPKGETRDLMLWAAGCLTLMAMFELRSRYVWQKFYRAKVAELESDELGVPAAMEAIPTQASQPHNQDPVERPRS